MGAVFSQRLVRAGFEEFVAWKQDNGYSLIGASGDAAQSYRSARYPSPCILLMGSERLGLTEAQRAACDLVVSIPMVGTGDSLNLGVATSVVLYELFHQRQNQD
jgi:TrmH family RNA methyltransferase